MAYVAADLASAQLDLLRVDVGLTYHCRPITSAIATANAFDLPSLLALLGAIVAAGSQHFGDVIVATTGVGAHLTADTTAIPSAPTSAAGANDCLRQLEGAFNSHVQKVGIHLSMGLPGSGIPSLPVASGGADLTSMINAANNVKTWFNAHIANRFASAAPT